MPTWWVVWTCPFQCKPEHLHWHQRPSLFAPTEDQNRKKEFTHIFLYFLLSHFLTLKKKKKWPLTCEVLDSQVLVSFPSSVLSLQTGHSQAFSYKAALMNRGKLLEHPLVLTLSRSFFPSTCRGHTKDILFGQCCLSRRWTPISTQTRGIIQVSH